MILAIVEGQNLKSFLKQSNPTMEGPPTSLKRSPSTFQCVLTALKFTIPIFDKIYLFVLSLLIVCVCVCVCVFVCMCVFISFHGKDFS